MLYLWSLVFFISLYLLIKGADWVVESAEQIALYFKISPFIIGMTIVALGTSVPELAASISAILKNQSQIPTAIGIGSNIANILLIIGISAILARSLIIKRSLIDLDIPLLAGVTLLFLGICWDRKINFPEGILLILGGILYAFYLSIQEREELKKRKEAIEVIPPSEIVRPPRVDRRKKEGRELIKKFKRKIFFLLLLGLLMIFLGAHLSIDSLVEISKFLKIPPSLISITLFALGTSLPELVVSATAASKKKYEISLGNIFGSNAFNILWVIGVPALLGTLYLDKITFNLGIPFLLMSTLLFVFSGISRKIHIWEGGIYLLIYLLFLGKLGGFF